MKFKLKEGEPNLRTAKLTLEQVTELRKAHHKGTPIRQLAADYGLTKQHVGRIVRGQAWTYSTLEVVP